MGAKTSSLEYERIPVYEPSFFGKRRVYISFGEKTLIIFEINQTFQRIIILTDLIGIKEKDTSSGKEIKFFFSQRPETETFVVPDEMYGGFKKEVLNIIQQNRSMYQKPDE